MRTPHIARGLALLVPFFGAALPALARPADAVTLPPDSPRWELDGQAKAADYLGRRCLYLDGGAATVKDFEMRDGVVDVDVATPAKRGCRSSASYAGEMLQRVSVPGGIAGRCRSQGASGVVRTSKFEKYAAPIKTASATWPFWTPLFKSSITSAGFSMSLK